MTYNLKIIDKAKKESINSFLLSVVLMITPINMFVMRVLGVQSSFIPILFVGSFFTAILVNRTIVTDFKVILVYILFLVMLLLTMITYMMNQYIIEYYINFLLCFTTSSYVIFNKINFKKLYQYLIFEITIFIPLGYEIVAKGLYDPGSRLGLSYAILPTFLVIIVTLTLKKNKFLKLIDIINFLFWSWFYLEIGNRGIFLCIAFFVIVFYLIKLDISYIKKAFLASIFICTIWYFISNFEVFLMKLNNFLLGEGIQIFFIQKTVFYLHKGDITNGRNVYSDFAIESIKNSPILGNGIGYFENRYGNYTHNIFLQVFVESGLLGLLFIAILICLFIYIILKKKFTKEEKIYLTILFCSGLLPLMLSKVYWTTFGFWVFVSSISYICNCKYLKSENDLNERYSEITIENNPNKMY